MEKTDLKTILAVSGEHGLFKYVAQAKSGMIAEHLETKRRTTFGVNARVTSLGDISIYTAESELPLKEVFRKLAAVLEGGEAPSPKSKPEEIRALFDKAVPDYDGDRFYASHMKKVVEWYNTLRQSASLEFVDEEDGKDAEKADA